MCVAQNGDELEVKMDLEKPGVIKIKGNDASEKYARFVTENDSVLKSGDVAAINALVADEVMAHPDRISMPEAMSLRPIRLSILLNLRHVRRGLWGHIPEWSESRFRPWRAEQ